ncbi:hypothetical protein K3556_01480 [Aliiroseovarius sp. M344]|uniref:hypothetical protein n=1 Tax=Aliiroseovarius sp. M344 TaxID=2867010 RepID=UPI0021AD6F34|nr:hypothetical protein [Aliiroseovarius sp. M344]UWQ14590.1 hypothetical protein K3556_01480 [Aliiroseovarius sp. M344]
MSARISATICDDFRREDSGKFIIVGGYSGGLGAFEFPVDDSFSCLLRGDSLPSDTKILTLFFRHVGYPMESKVLDVDGLEGDPFLFALPKIPVRAKSPGDFFIEVALDDGRKKKIEKLSIFDAREDS